jgi:hypothetical protein
MQQNFADIEKNQAELRDLIEQSKRLSEDSDDLLKRSRRRSPKSTDT